MRQLTDDQLQQAQVKLEVVRALGGLVKQRDEFEATADFTDARDELIYVAASTAIIQTANNLADELFASLEIPQSTTPDGGVAQLAAVIELFDGNRRISREPR